MEGQPTKDSEIHFLDYLIVLAKYSRMIIYTSAAVMLITYFKLLIGANSYTAEGRFIPPGKNMTMSGQFLTYLGSSSTVKSAPSGLGGLASEVMGFKSPGAFYIGIMNGNTIMDRVIERFKLKEKFQVQYVENARNRLRDKVNITEGKDELILIKVTDEDPQFASQIANAFLEELSALFKEMTVDEANIQLAFLEKERNQISKNLAKAEEDLRTFSEQKNVLQIDAQARGTIEYIARIRADIDYREVELKVLQQKATPFNYDIVKAETEIKALREKLQTLEERSAINPCNSVVLTSAVVPALAIEYVRLIREAKYQENLYELYCKLVEMARIDKLRDPVSLQIVDRPKPPEGRSNKRLLPTMITGLVTFFIMIFVAFAREFWHSMALSEGDAARLNELQNYINRWRSDIGRLFFWRKITRRS